MKDVTIIINGKEYTAQMSDEAVADITAVPFPLQWTVKIIKKRNES